MATFRKSTDPQVHRLEEVRLEDGSVTWRLLQHHTGEIRECSDPLTLIGCLARDVLRGDFGEAEIDTKAGLIDNAITALVVASAAQRRDVQPTEGAA